MCDSGWLGYSVQARSLKCLYIKQSPLKMGGTTTTYNKGLFQSLRPVQKKFISKLFSTFENTETTLLWVLIFLLRLPPFLPPPPLVPLLAARTGQNIFVLEFLTLFQQQLGSTPPPPTSPTVKDSFNVARRQKFQLQNSKRKRKIGSSRKHWKPNF